MSGMGHMTSFCGSETIPAIAALEEYYNADAEGELIAATIKRLITEVYPSGFVSIVSDTWDYWKVITDYLPRLKDEILARDGRVVIRPDSGNPVDIICGWPLDVVEEATWEELAMPETTGTYEMLWNIFGGTINEKGYKVLDPHIGIIYGDSIDLAVVLLAC